MSGRSQLFGQIAKRYGYVTEEQVRQALDRQDRYLAAHVQKPIGEVLKEMGLLTDRRIARILRAQGFRRERSASKDVGRVAIEEGMVTQAQVEECLALQEARFREKKEMWSLADLLFEKKHIDRRQQRTLLRAQKRMEQGRSDRVTTVAYGVKECGGCFEMVSLDAKQCPKCGSPFGAVEMAVHCAKCNAPAADGGEFCARCGANLVTGDVAPHTEPARCPSCGRIMSPLQRICFQCGFVRPQPLLAQASKAASRALSLVWGAGRPLVALLVLIALVIVAIRFGPRLLRTSSELAYGEHESAFHRRVDELAKGVLYKNLPLIRKALVSDPAETRDGDLISALVGAKGVAVEVLSLTVAEVHVEGKEAYAYLDARLKCEVEPPPHEKTGNAWADLEQAIGSALAKGKEFEKRTTWRFRLEADDWRLETP